MKVRCMMWAGAVMAGAFMSGGNTRANAAVLVVPAFSTVFTNPAPQSGEEFGNALAAVGSSQVLVGAWKDHHGLGAAHLFRLDGTLVSSFADPSPVAVTNLSPVSPARFGFAVAGLGEGRVIIGAPYKNASAYVDGSAFLFSTGGTLLVTFLNPNPASQDQFGRAVAAVGTDKVLISAPLSRLAGNNAGAAYLFDTNGTLLRTFTHAPSWGFGMAVAAPDADHVLIGVGGTNILSAGAVVRLFHIDGTLVTTFTNPAPTGTGADRFGWAVASLGPDKVLVGASHHAGASGEAYLFSTNGTLLTTFANPTPESGAEFGRTLVGMGPDKVAIAAHKAGAGTQDGGVVHVFGLEGGLLATITNPPPRALDYFGYGLAALGDEKLAIGAICRVSGGYFAAGTAYLVSLVPELPLLTVECLTTGDVCVSWPAPATGFVLETSALMSAPGGNVWSQAPYPYQTNATRISIALRPAAHQFYRLRKQ